MTGVNLLLNEARLHPDGLHLSLFHPRSENQVSHLVIGLCDTRSADEIRVSYDFERDGWKIEQGSVFEFEPDDNVCDPMWKEVAFVKAWGLVEYCKNPAVKCQPAIYSASKVPEQDLDEALIWTESYLATILERIASKNRG